MSEAIDTAELEAVAPPPAPPMITYELDLSPDDLDALLRQPELLFPNSRRRLAASRTTRRSEIWHDTPDGELAATGLSLAQTHIGGAPIWRLQRLVPLAGDIAPPGLPAGLIGENNTPPTDLPATLVPIAAFDGTMRVLRPASHPPHVMLMQGELRAVKAVRPVCRLLISDHGARELALHWAGLLHLNVPRATLAGEALALTGRSLPPPPLGAPTLNAEQTVSEGFAAVVAHLAGVMLHYAPLADGQHGQEPVHQMRVALRRLRSAISLFRRATSCPAVEDATLRLKQLGHVLGPPRDWDVFTMGTGAKIGEAFADDVAVQDLLAAAERKRRAGYTALAAFMASPEWRQLGIALAAISAERPWDAEPATDEPQAALRRDMLTAPLHHFAARMLSRRHRSLIAPGPDLSDLPIEALHDIRLAGKRLRYAAEFFAPLFPGRDTKRFLRRIGIVQECLGSLNDGAVAGALMAQLANRSAARAGAIGVVRGFVCASSSAGRKRIERAWKRLLHQGKFWL